MNRFWQRAVFGGCLAAAATSFGAVKFYWTGTADDNWTDQSKWFFDADLTQPATSIPGGGAATDDQIILSPDTTIIAHDADRDRLANIGRIYVHDNAQFVFDNTGTTDEDCLVYGGRFNYNTEMKGTGKVVKNGPGTLKLTAPSGTAMSLKNGYEINDGRVETPGYATMNWKAQDYGRVTVNAPGVLAISTNIMFTVDGLWGDGEITSVTDDSKAKVYLYVRGDADASRTAVFSGSVTGIVSIRPDAGRYDLLGSSTASGSVTILDQADVGISTFGDNGSAGAFGTREYQQRGLFSRLRYLGLGETSSRWFSLHEGSGHFILDAGTNGPLTFARSGNGVKAEAGGVKVFELAGEGSQTNVFNMAIDEYNADPTNYIHLVKSGAGRWEMKSSLSVRHRGSVSVERGTLAVVGLAEANSACSLGYGTIRQQPYAGIYDPDKDVDWSIRLGCPTNDAYTGLLEYKGDSPATVTTRPIAVTGRGGLVQAPNAGMLEWTGVRAADAAGGTLVLGGETEGAKINTVNDVADGPGTLGVEKVGPGAWRLNGNVAFTGDLNVKEGTLYVTGNMTNRADFTWFRLTIRGNRGSINGVTESSTHVSELGFFEEDGTRVWAGNGLNNFVSGGIKDAKSTAYFGDLSNLQPGSYGWVETPYFNQGYYYNYGDRDATNLFDNVASKNGLCFSYRDGTKVSPTVPSNFGILLVRMPTTAQPIRSFDLVSNSNAGTPNRFLTDWTMEGSSDGVVWHVLKTFDYADGDMAPTGVKKWYSDNSDWTSTNKPEKRQYVATDANPKGYPVAVETATSDALGKMKSVAVAKGATLVAEGLSTVKGLVLSTAGAGTLKGVTFAPEGELVVTGERVDGVQTVDFDALIGCSGAENVSNWTVKTPSGRILRGTQAVLQGTRLTVYAPGLMLLVK